jgi:hypothetical protein
MVQRFGEQESGISNDRGKVRRERKAHQPFLLFHANIAYFSRKKFVERADELGETDRHNDIGGSIRSEPSYVQYVEA